MIELVFVACLTATPDVCEERVQSFLPELGVHGCMLTAQQHIAAWTATNPERRVVRWRCGLAGARALQA